MLTMAHPEHSEATKQKLRAMVDGLDEFQVLMRHGTREKAEKDAFRIAALKSDIVEAEKAVAAEVDKRLEMSKSLQSWADTQVAAIRSKADAMLSSAIIEINAKLASVHARISELERKFEADRVEVLAEVERRNEELVDSLKAFNAAFEEERASRVARERAIMERLAKEENDSIRRFDEERAVREQVYMAAKKRLEEAVAARSKADEKFQTTVLAEVAAVKNAVAAEERARIAEDDEIAETMHRYVQKLQASLAVLNSEDTVM